MVVVVVFVVAHAVKVRKIPTRRHHSVRSPRPGHRRQRMNMRYH